jgi:long-chain acyl-CoA synthetase
MARVEQVKKFTVLPRELSIAEGELTPTLKVKRNVVNDHFADDIEAMYAGS